MGANDKLEATMHDGRCTSTYRGNRCTGEFGHRANGNVWTEPLSVHHAGPHYWADAAADLEPHDIQEEQ